MRFFLHSVALTCVINGAVLASPGVSPASVSKKSDPDSLFNVDKIVSTPEIPPKPDLVFLVDVTASMGSAIGNIKSNLDNVISTVNSGQPNALFAVASFGDLDDSNGFQVNQALTNNVPALQSAVNSLKAEFGRDVPEDWINALYKLSTGSINFRGDSSRIIVLVSDAPSHDPSGGHTLAAAINALTAQRIRVIGVNIKDLDVNGQATAVTKATGGVIIGSAADAVTKAIVSGLKNLDVTITPSVVSCDAGLTVEFKPTETKVSSGSTVTFNETVKVAKTATQGSTARCTVRFLLNGAPGGDAFNQSVAVSVNQISCFTCIPQPGKNLCHPTTSCSSTPYGTMCLTRPGYKADGADDDDVKVQWRLKWPVPGQEHRVAVKPGRSADTLCSPKNKGSDVCKEITVSDCSTPILEDEHQNADQRVTGDGEL